MIRISPPTFVSLSEQFGKKSVTAMLGQATDPSPVFYSIYVFPQAISVYNRNTRLQVELLYNTSYSVDITAILCRKIYWSRSIELHYNGKSLAP